jgi:hypothetical protein
MGNRCLNFAAAVAFATISWLSLRNSAEPVRPALPDIDASQFNDARVIGYLGHPLGTVVRVTGVCTDDTETQRRADLGKTLLKILTVNGKPLKRPFIVEFLRAKKEVPEPGFGDHFDYYVHEWGVFDGHVDTPKELGIEELPVANDGFYYRSEVTVHKANPVKELAPAKRASRK